MKTLKQVAELTGIKPDNLRQRMARKTLKGRKIGNTWVIGDAELQKLKTIINLKRTNVTTH